MNSDQVSGIDGMVRWNDRVNDFNYFVGVNLTLARQKTINNYGEVFLNGWDQYRWAQTNRWSNVKMVPYGCGKLSVCSRLRKKLITIR